MMASNIMTADEIESAVANIKGTWVKRSNARKRMTARSNDEVEKKIMLIKGEIRKLKAVGAKQQELRHLYADINKLELQKI